MTPVIDTIKSHRSIRAFKNEPINAELLDQIVQSGIAASSSSLLQVVSIIRVTDKDKREKLAEYAGNQPYVASASEFLVFCIDYHRHFELNPSVQSDYMELTLIGAADAGIMAQNCLLAAESLGLGGVYIGGLRNQIDNVDKLLGLPSHCAVLFGMCLGYPDQDPQLKPRLPQSIIMHENTYQPLDKKIVERYDKDMRDYYRSRTSNAKISGWSDEATAKLSKESRPHILGYLNSKELARK
ncbi:oxygen-insensitive NADPH nitroreductase [Vibrio viridaestus]|uniref:Oxygen-insensitive NADPH nitroreductase n=1 Tax=Vibrio viridaestus TaxID=2487322 RepID=A0A3N9TDI1_9VIBR|nr:oxygen-insensitive NADPH nitroreductase [Vibrio viridaestus]RQW62268.1 oxygen-insensitive NADPH nitroreductase [Vibrio viridaestus]